ncbi:MAG: hypothetical protein K2H47_00725, partial [Muribaculaceae bacterium]|nr:hypothetical protein [Muribaculaceae bacterium]
YIILSVISTSLFILLQNFVSLYTADISNKEDYINPLLGGLMITNMMLHNVKTPQGMLVLSAGLFKETRWQTTTQGALAIICGALLGYFFGIYGIIVGIIISNIYRDIDLMFFIPTRVTGLDWISTASKIIVMFVSIGFSVIILNLIILNSHSWITWIIDGFICVIIALIITVIIFYIFFPKIIKESFQQLKAIKR